MIHFAGALTPDGVQRCTRCGYILTDYRGAMVPVGQPPLRGWIVGASIEVLEGNPRFSGLTDVPPDCKVGLPQRFRGLFSLPSVDVWNAKPRTPVTTAPARLRDRLVFLCRGRVVIQLFVDDPS